MTGDEVFQTMAAPAVSIDGPRNDGPPTNEYLAEYYQQERSALEKAAASGALREVIASDGRMYVFPTEADDFVMAVVLDNGMVIRNGDNISMERGLQNGEKTKLETFVSDFAIDEGNHQLHFRQHSKMAEESASIFDLRHAIENISAIVRADQAERDLARLRQ